MNKTYYFLAGLHRSGNTVLSSILNQNPEIYSSPLSPVSEYMWQTYSAIKTAESSISNMYPDRSKNVLSKIIENYYSDVNKPIIFDREKNWAHPENIKVLKEAFDFNIKIIFTTRPIVEVLASYIAINKKQIIEWMNNLNFKMDDALTLNENMCEFLMNSEGEIRRVLFSLESIDHPDNHKLIHVVKYEDLLSTPEKVMTNIYNFLEIDYFKHDFNNIIKIEEYNESAANLPDNLHEVRSTISRSGLKIEDYLTPYSINKYKDVRYF